MKPIQPPEGTTIGSAVTFPKYENLPLASRILSSSDTYTDDSNNSADTVKSKLDKVNIPPPLSYNRINKAFGRVVKHLKVNGEGIAVWDNISEESTNSVVFMTQRGSCTGSIPNGNIS